MFNVKHTPYRATESLSLVFGLSNCLTTNHKKKKDIYHSSVTFLLIVSIFLPTCLQDPASSTGLEADSDTREGEAVTINYKPSPLQMKIGEPELQFLSKESDIIMLRSAHIRCRHSLRPRFHWNERFFLIRWKLFILIDVDVLHVAK